MRSEDLCHECGEQAECDFCGLRYCYQCRYDFWERVPGRAEKVLEWARNRGLPTRLSSLQAQMDKMHRRELRRAEARRQMRREN